MLDKTKHLRKSVIAISLAILLAFSSLRPAFALQLYPNRAVAQSFHPAFIQFLIPVIEFLVEAAAADAVSTAAGAAAAGAVAAGAVETGAAEAVISAVTGAAAAGAVAAGAVETGAAEAVISAVTGAAAAGAVATGVAEAAVSAVTEAASVGASAITTAAEAVASVRAPALALGISLEESGLANTLAILTNVAPEMRAAQVLSEYELNAPFSGVYHPPTNQWFTMASENAVLKSGRAISTVPRAGGHGHVQNEFIKKTGITDTSKNVGFTLFKRGERTLEIRWKSGTVNRKNFQQPEAPLEHREALKKDIERETGYQVEG